MYVLYTYIQVLYRATHKNFHWESFKKIQKKYKCVYVCQPFWPILHATYGHPFASGLFHYLHEPAVTLMCLLLPPVVGCPDPDLPSDMWSKRENNDITIGCKDTDETWEMRCSSDSTWVGSVGNCSAGKDSESLRQGIALVENTATCK